MDEGELEMMMCYCLFLRRKPKINWDKKGDSGLDPSFKKEKDLVNIYDFDYTIILILCRAIFRRTPIFAEQLQPC